MPRTDLTLSKKIELLDIIKIQPVKTTHRRLALLTNVPKSTLTRIIQQENKLRDEWALHEGKAGTSKRKRNGKAPDVEEALNQWFSTVTGRGESISGPILKAKSEELAKKMGHYDFKATDGWLSRWKARCNIKFKKVLSVNTISADEWKNDKIPTYLDNFCADDIYSVDQFNLYYRATSDGYKYNAQLDDKKIMDCITVLCCTNMSGSDKRKLLIIGKSANPRCFNGLRWEGLPVKYQANKKASLTSEIFLNWLTSWNVELQHEQRQILLLVGNCLTHPCISNPTNVNLEFFPENIKSLLHPMDMGIIKNLKTLYRAKLMNYVLESIDEKLLTSCATANKISVKVNLLQVIQFVADSWRAMKSDTIQNCFALCGLKQINILENLNDNQTNDISPVFINNYLETGYIENKDDAIFETKLEHLTSEEDNETDNESDDEPVPVTNQEARKCIAKLQHYFMQVGNDESPIYALNACADFVQLQSSSI